MTIPMKTSPEKTAVAKDLRAAVEAAHRSVAQAVADGRPDVAAVVGAVRTLCLEAAESGPEKFARRVRAILTAAKTMDLDALGLRKVPQPRNHRGDHPYLSGPAKRALEGAYGAFAKAV